MRFILAAVLALAPLLIAQDAPKPEQKTEEKKADAKGAGAPRAMGPPTNLKVLKLTQGNEVARCT
jgi:hypothetical protein